MAWGDAGQARTGRPERRALVQVLLGEVNRLLLRADGERGEADGRNRGPPAAVEAVPWIVIVVPCGMEASRAIVLTP
jgi:hypothetical protein